MHTRSLWSQTTNGITPLAVWTVITKYTLLTLKISQFARKKFGCNCLCTTFTAYEDLREFWSPQFSIFQFPIIHSVCQRLLLRNSLRNMQTSQEHLKVINVYGKFREGQTEWIMWNWEIENESYTKQLRSKKWIKGDTMSYLKKMNIGDYLQSIPYEKVSEVTTRKLRHCWWPCKAFWRRLIANRNHCTSKALCSLCARVLIWFLHWRPLCLKAGAIPDYGSSFKVILAAVFNLISIMHLFIFLMINCTHTTENEIEFSASLNLLHVTPSSRYWKSLAWGSNNFIG